MILHIANDNRFENRDKLEAQFAGEADLDGMLAVLKKNLIADKKLHEIDKNNVEANGFLVGPFTAEEISNHLAATEKHVILVLIEEERVIGYLISYDLQQVDKTMYEEFVSFPEIDAFKDKKKILYYRQIAKLPGKANVGSTLLKKMLEEAKSMGYEAVVCRIVHQPLRNKISIGFHEDFGFKCLGMVKNDEITLGVYFKELV